MIRARFPVRAFRAGCAALLLGSPAFAQSDAPGEAPEQAGDNIVVTGRTETPPTTSEVTHQARSVTEYTTAIRQLPLARFQNPLCPGIYGLNGASAGPMIDRIRANAERLELRMTEDDGTCRPNFVVAFVDDGQATIRRLQHDYRWLFRDMPFNRKVELREQEGPVRVWTATQTLTRDGMPLGSTQWMAHSRIYLSTREDIYWVLVLIDREAAAGKTLMQLADYATMRGLARTRPVEGDGQPMDTILALFDPQGSPPLQMTSFDQAYLGSLYDGIPNIPGITKVQGVNRQLRLQAEAEERAEPDE